MGEGAEGGGDGGGEEMSAEADLVDQAFSAVWIETAPSLHCLPALAHDCYPSAKMN